MERGTADEVADRVKQKLSEISCGVMHCASIDSKGQLWTWGNGTKGQLGRDSGYTDPRMVVFKEKVRVVKVACGSFHSIALVDSMNVYSWGLGKNGRLGHGNSESCYVPKKIDALAHKRIKTIACGADFSVAASADLGTLYSWGMGRYGNLGHGSNSDVFSPRTVDGLQGNYIKVVAAGAKHTLALDSNGQVWSFGFGGGGRLGFGDTIGSFSPKMVTGLKNVNVINVSAGESHSAALGAQGAVYLWGMGDYGKLGTGEVDDMLYPYKVNSLATLRIVQIECGAFHTIGLSEAGDLYAWGGAAYGKLGLGKMDNTYVLEPTKISLVCRDRATVAAPRFCMVSVGPFHSIAVDDNGYIYSWGWNGLARLRNSEKQDPNMPDDNINEHPTPVKALGSSIMSTLANSDLATWRKSLSNASAAPVISSKPVKVRINFVACGAFHSMALHNETVFVWGKNSQGQLGLGDTDDRKKPTPVDSLNNVRKIAAGGTTSFALTGMSVANNESGHYEVYGWGSNEHGQLGLQKSKKKGRTDEMGYVTVPTKVSDSLPRVENVSCGDGHTVAWNREDGKCFAWGAAASGQLGLDSTEDCFEPMPIEFFGSGTKTEKRKSTDRNITLSLMACGGSHTVALSNTGDVFAWGSNSKGQLGVGTDLSKIWLQKPLVLSMLRGKEVVVVACGRNHTITITTNFEVHSWGDNSHGQLGLGPDVITAREPTPVLAFRKEEATKVICGDDHSVVIMKMGETFSFGRNNFGQLGLGTHDEFVTEPTMIDVGSARIDDGACGSAHTLLVSVNGDIYSFGQFAGGRLGLPPSLDKNVHEPRLIESLSSSSPSSTTSTQADGSSKIKSAKAGAPGGPVQQSSSAGEETGIITMETAFHRNSEDAMRQLQLKLLARGDPRFGDLVVFARGVNAALPQINDTDNDDIAQKMRSALWLETCQLRHYQEERMKLEDKIRLVASFDRNTVMLIANVFGSLGNQTDTANELEAAKKISPYFTELTEEEQLLKRRADLIQTRRLYEGMFGILLTNHRYLCGILISLGMSEQKTKNINARFWDTLSVIFGFGDPRSSVCSHAKTEVYLRLTETVMGATSGLADFEEEAILTKLLKLFGRHPSIIVATARILKAPLREFVQKLEGRKDTKDKGGDTNLEIRPHKVYAQIHDLEDDDGSNVPDAISDKATRDEIEKRTSTLITLLGDLIRSIFSIERDHIHLFPYELRWMIRELSEKIKEKNKKDTMEACQRKACAKFMWRMCFRHAFLHPADPIYIHKVKTLDSNGNITEKEEPLLFHRPSARMQRNLQIVSDLIMAAVDTKNPSPPQHEREIYMQVIENNVTIELFLQNIVDLPRESTIATLKEVTDDEMFVFEKVDKRLTQERTIKSTQNLRELETLYRLLKRTEVKNHDELRLNIPSTSLFDMHLMMGVLYTKASSQLKVGGNRYGPDPMYVILKSMTKKTIAPVVSLSMEPPVDFTVRPGNFEWEKYLDPDFLRVFISHGFLSNLNDMNETDVSTLLAPFVSHLEKLKRGSDARVGVPIDVTINMLQKMKCPHCEKGLPPDTFIQNEIYQFICSMYGTDMWKMASGVSRRDDHLTMDAPQDLTEDERMSRCQQIVFRLVSQVADKWENVDEDMSLDQFFTQVSKQVGFNSTLTKQVDFVKTCMSLSKLGEDLFLKNIISETHASVRTMTSRFRSIEEEKSILMDAAEIAKNSKRKLKDQVNAYEEFLAWSESSTFDPMMFRKKTDYERKLEEESGGSRVKNSGDGELGEDGRIARVQVDTSRKNNKVYFKLPTGDDNVPYVDPTVTNLRTGRPVQLHPSDMVRDCRMDLKQMFLGPYRRLSHKELEVMGVIVTSRVPRAPLLVRRQVKFEFFSFKPGQYIVVATYKHQVIMHEQFLFSQLLELEEKGQPIFKASIVGFDIRALKYLLSFIFDVDKVIHQQFAHNKAIQEGRIQIPFLIGVGDKTLAADRPIIAMGMLCCGWFQTVRNKQNLQDLENADKESSGSGDGFFHALNTVCCHEFFVRRKIRGMSHDETPEWLDALTVCCCPCMAAIQDGRELKRIRTKRREQAASYRRQNLRSTGGNIGSTTEPPSVVME